MISSIIIENFIIIDHLEIKFCNGFSSITGETGTGKSIIIDAINFCFGKINTKNIKKSLDKQCYVEIHIDDKIVSRKIDTNNKHTCYLNGKKIQLKELKKLMQNLIDITAQSDTILSKESQYEKFNRFVIAHNTKLVEKFDNLSKLFYEIKSVEKEITLLHEKTKLENRNKEYYLQIVSELGQLDLKQNEETNLIVRRSEIAQTCSHFNFIKETLELLHSPSISDNLTHSIRNLEKLKDTTIDALKNRLSSVVIELDDVIKELEDFKNTINSQETELQEIDERISLLKTVARKYNTSSATLFEFLYDAKHELNYIENFDVNLNNLLLKREQLESEYDSIAEIIHNERIKIAKNLSNLVCVKLKELAMPNATFEININKINSRTKTGSDDIEFLANFNKNTTLLPVMQIASGGEATRLHFAIKSILSVHQTCQTLIFDEIDIGIGGSVAFAIGNSMKNLAVQNNLQVISITHSPQVASRADYNILIKKNISNSDVSVTALQLNNDERIKEIARMFSGDTISDESLNLAKQLLIN